MIRRYKIKTYVNVLSIDIFQWNKYSLSALSTNKDQNKEFVFIFDLNQ